MQEKESLMFPAVCFTVSNKSPLSVELQMIDDWAVVPLPQSYKYIYGHSEYLLMSLSATLTALIRHFIMRTNISINSYTFADVLGIELWKQYCVHIWELRRLSFSSIHPLPKKKCFCKISVQRLLWGFLHFNNAPDIFSGWRLQTGLFIIQSLLEPCCCDVCWMWLDIILLK